MLDREHIAIDQEARVVHHAIRGCEHVAACRDVDPSMAGRIPRGRCNERSHDPMGSVHRPGPQPMVGDGWTGGGGERQSRGQRDGGCDEAKHPFILAGTIRAIRSPPRSAQRRPEMRPVSERCYPFRSIPSNWDDYACPLHPSRCAHIHSVDNYSRILGSRSSRSRGRVRTPGSAPNGSDNN
jgi:hypothetical protein